MNAKPWVVALLVGCGPAPAAQAPDAPKDADPASAAATSAATAAAAADAPKAKADSPSEALARDLLKSGGRRIAWSAQKKRFIVPTDARAEGGRGLDLKLYDDEGAQRDIQRVCQPGECEERLDEIIKDLLPKLAARLDGEGYEAVSSIGWPDGRDELDVGTLNAKLKLDRGGISIVKEKKATSLRGGRLKGTPTVIYPVPGAKLLGVVAGDFFVLKLP